VAHDVVGEMREKPSCLHYLESTSIPAAAAPVPEEEIAETRVMVSRRLAADTDRGLGGMQVAPKKHLVALSASPPPPRPTGGCRNTRRRRWRRRRTGSGIFFLPQSPGLTFYQRF